MAGHWATLLADGSHSAQLYEVSLRSHLAAEFEEDDDLVRHILLQLRSLGSVEALQDDFVDVFGAEDAPSVAKWCWAKAEELACQPIDDAADVPEDEDDDDLLAGVDAEAGEQVAIAPVAQQQLLQDKQKEQQQQQQQQAPTTLHTTEAQRAAGRQLRSVALPAAKHDDDRDKGRRDSAQRRSLSSTVAVAAGTARQGGAAGAQAASASADNGGGQAGARRLTGARPASGRSLLGKALQQIGAGPAKSSSAPVHALPSGQPADSKPAAAPQVQPATAPASKPARSKTSVLARLSGLDQLAQQHQQPKQQQPKQQQPKQQQQPHQQKQQQQPQLDRVKPSIFARLGGADAAVAAAAATSAATASVAHSVDVRISAPQSKAVQSQKAQQQPAAVSIKQTVQQQPALDSAKLRQRTAGTPLQSAAEKQPAAVKAAAVGTKRSSAAVNTAAVAGSEAAPAAKRQVTSTAAAAAAAGNEAAPAAAKRKATSPAAGREAAPAAAKRQVTGTSTGAASSSDKAKQLAALRAALAAKEAELRGLQAAADTDERSVVLVGVHPAATETVVAAHFACCGDVRRVMLLPSRRAGPGAPGAYVEFADTRSALAALGLTGSPLLGLPVQVARKTSYEANKVKGQRSYVALRAKAAAASSGGGSTGGSGKVIPSAAAVPGARAGGITSPSSRGDVGVSSR